jgi:hypothetical protein
VTPSVGYIIVTFAADDGGTKRRPIAWVPATLEGTKGGESVRSWGTGVLLLVCFVALATLPSSGAMMGMDLVGSIKTQLKTAAFHAGELAQRGDTVAGTHLHLHHTINCLEGQSGPDYLASAGYPCQGQGNGIIPDLKTAVMHMVPGAQQSLDDANIALKLALQAEGMSDVAQAQPWAHVVATYLMKASDDLQ